MNAKEYLNQVGIIDAQIKVIESNIERIRKELYLLDDISLTSSWTDGQPHGVKIGDPTGRKASELADATNAKKESLKKSLAEYEHQQMCKRSELWSRRMEVIGTITKIAETPDAMSRVYYKLLIARYIDFMSWEQIAVEIGYTIRHTWRLHGEALRRIERIIEQC